MNAVRDFLSREPVLIISVLTSAVVFVAAKFGVVLDEQGVGQALALIVPLLLSGVVARSQVSPAE